MRTLNRSFTPSDEHIRVKTCRSLRKFQSIRLNSRYIYKNIHRYISVYVVMLYSAIFTQITRIIIYFDHFRYSKDKHVGMQMKPYIPSKEWYLCFSSRKTNEYATDKKLRGECFHSAIFHAYYAYYYLF